MEKSSFILENESATTAQKESNLQEPTQSSIQRDLRDLVHAHHSRDVNFKISTCLKVSKILNHIKTCNSGDNLRCPVCKQCAALIFYHAKTCQEATCSIPSCITVKDYFLKLYMQLRLQQGHSLKKGISTLPNGIVHSAVPKRSSNNSNSSWRPASGSQPNSLLHRSKPNIGIKPPTASPAMFLQTFRESPTASHTTAPTSVNDGKDNSVVCSTANPALTESQQMENQGQKPISPLMFTIPNQITGRSNVAGSEGTNYGQRPQPHPKPQPQLSQHMRLKQPSQFIRAGNMPNKSQNFPVRTPQIKRTARQLAHAMRKIHNALRASSQTRRQQVFSALKSNPRLISIFMDQSPALQQQQKQVPPKKDNLIATPDQSVRKQHQINVMLALRSARQFSHSHSPKQAQHPHLPIPMSSSNQKGKSTKFSLQQQPQQLPMPPQVSLMTSPTHSAINQENLGHLQAPNLSPQQASMHQVASQLQFLHI